VSRTRRLELDDQTLREWDAIVLDSGPDGIVLGRISVVKVENKGKGFRRLRIAIAD
jgi:Ser-tRNA(Ala) deacylase AlaX